MTFNNDIYERNRIIEMNIGIVLENHRWFNIIEEAYSNYKPIKCSIYNMDHEFIKFSIGNNDIWVTVAMGASIAVSMAEKLIQDFDCLKIFRIGTAGSLVDNILVGDYCLSYAGIKGEGTSKYYIEDEVPAVGPILALMDFYHFVDERVSPYSIHMVLTFSTDGRWKEVPRKIENYKRVGAQTIDMESSALLSMGMDRQIDVYSISIVSDSPLNDEEEFIGIIKEGVWEDVIMKRFEKLFSVCIEWSAVQ